MNLVSCAVTGLLLSMLATGSALGQVPRKDGARYGRAAVATQPMPNQLQAADPNSRRG